MTEGNEKIKGLYLQSERKTNVVRGSKTAIQLLSRKGVRDLTKINSSDGEIVSLITNGEDKGSEVYIKTIFNFLEVLYRNSLVEARKNDPNIKESTVELYGAKEMISNLTPNTHLMGKGWTPILLEFSSHCKEVYGDDNKLSKDKAKAAFEYLSMPNFDVCDNENYTLKQSLVFVSESIIDKATRKKYYVIYLNPILTQNSISNFVRWRGDLTELMKGRRTLMDWKLITYLIIGFSERTLHKTELGIPKLWERIATSSTYTNRPGRRNKDFDKAIALAIKVGLLDSKNPIELSEDKKRIRFNYNPKYLES